MGHVIPLVCLNLLSQSAIFNRLNCLLTIRCTELPASDFLPAGQPAHAQ